MVRSTVNGILPYVFSYISHFVCLYNFNYTGRSLRGPGIIGILVLIITHRLPVLIISKYRIHILRFLHAKKKSIISRIHRFHEIISSGDRIFDTNLYHSLLRCEMTIIAFKLFDLFKKLLNFFILVRNGHKANFPQESLCKWWNRSKHGKLTGKFFKKNSL